MEVSISIVTNCKLVPFMPVLSDSSQMPPTYEKKKFGKQCHRSLSEESSSMLNLLSQIIGIYKFIAYTCNIFNKEALI